MISRDSTMHIILAVHNIHNTQVPSVTLLELTCPLDSGQHIQAARDRKQDEVEYLQLLAELDCLNISNYYETIEITARTLPPFHHQKYA